MSRTPFEVPAKPAAITLETLPALFAHHKAAFGGWSMTITPPEGGAPQERPEGVTEDEWTALGDPGRAALSREREARQTAERALAATKARPAPPKATETPKAPEVKPESGKTDSPDVAALIEQAVQAAIKPLVEREQARDTQAAAEKIQQVVLDAAKDRLHDASDAIANIDLTTVVNDQGQADAAKIATALEGLIKNKPHLAKATQRFAPPGIGGGAPATGSEADRVKAVLAEMQRTTGVRSANSN